MGCGPSSCPTFRRAGECHPTPLPSFPTTTTQEPVTPCSRGALRYKECLPSPIRRPIPPPCPHPHAKTVSRKGWLWSFTLGTSPAALPLRTHPRCLWARSPPARPSIGSQPQRPAPGAGQAERRAEEWSQPGLRDEGDGGTALGAEL